MLAHPQLELAAPDVDKPIPDAEVEAADKNASGKVCSKGTPSGHILTRDDNPNTPSQPCPPAFALVGKQGAVKVPADFSGEDDNGNGVVCWKETRPKVYIAMDDNLATPSQPCPPAFSVESPGKKKELAGT